MWIPSIVRKASLLIRLLRGRKVKLGKAVYYTRAVVLDTGLGFKNELIEKGLLPVYRAMLSCRGGAFVDVGANVGQTMRSILSLDAHRAYIGFDPQISCCCLLQQFFEDNSLSTHAIFPVGLSDKNGIVKLQRRDTKHDQTASIIHGFRPDPFYSSYRWIAVRPGDEVMAELKHPLISVVKIDVEGAELEVLQGFLNTIRDQKPFVVFEVLNNFIIATGTQLADENRRFRASRIECLEYILRGLGYDIYSVRPQGLTRVLKIEPSASADLSLTNYAAISNQDIESFFKILRSCALRH